MYVAIPLIIYCGERTIRSVRAGNYEVKVVKVRFFQTRRAGDSREFVISGTPFLGGLRKH